MVASLVLTGIFSHMGNKADFRRRLIGAIFLIAAATMLIAGETILSARLKPSPALTLAYWGLCFVAVFLAILVALLDLWIIRRRSREEARGLLDETLGQIAREEKNRSQSPKRNSGAP